MGSSRLPAGSPATSGRSAPAGRPPRGLRHEPSRFLTSTRFLIRSLNLRGAAFLLALLAVAVGATVTATVLNLKAGLKDKMSRELRAYGPNLLIVPRVDAEAQRPGDAASIALLEEDLRAVPEVLGAPSAVVPELIAGGTAGGHPATIVGADFEALHRLYPGWRLDPALPAGPACVLGATLSGRAGARAGDSIEIGSGTASAAIRVAAVLSTGEAEDEQVFVPLAFLQGLLDRPGQISFAALSIEGGAGGVARASGAIDRALPRLKARPLPAIALAQGALLDRLDRMMLLLTLVILLLAGLCLVTTLMSMVVERESEIGLARAIGAGDGEIFRMFLGEIGLLGVLGSLAGLVLGAGVTRLIGERLFGAPIEARLSVAPIVFGLSMIICLIAVYVPLRRALSIQPAMALRGE